MRTASLVITILLFLTMACVAQSAFADFEKEHERAVKENPPGVKVVIGLKNGRSTFHRSDVLQFTVTFKAQKADQYSVALFEIGNSRDTFVLQPPSPLKLLKVKGMMFGCVGPCREDRVRIGASPITADSVRIDFARCARRVFVSDIFEPGDKYSRATLPYGEYAIYFQTRRVADEWSRTDRLLDEMRQPLLTSENIVRIKIVADNVSTEVTAAH